MRCNGNSESGVTCDLTIQFCSQPLHDLQTSQENKNKKQSLKQSLMNEFIHPWLFFLFVDLLLYLCCCRNSKHKWSKTYPTHCALVTVKTENCKAFNHRERSGKVESTYYAPFQHLWLETKSVSLGSNGQVLNPKDLILTSLCSFLVGGEFCGRMQAQGEHTRVMGMTSWLCCENKTKQEREREGGGERTTTGKAGGEIYYTRH